MYNYKCEYCKALLDPGERCDCIEKVERKIRSKKKANIIATQLFEQNSFEQEIFEFCK